MVGVQLVHNLREIRVSSEITKGKHGWKERVENRAAIQGRRKAENGKRNWVNLQEERGQR